MERITSNLLLVACVVLAWGRLSAQTNGWQPSPGDSQRPIWPGTVPDAQPVPGPEAVLSNTDWVVAGKPFVFVVNVSQPTMTVYSPKEANAGVHLYAQGGHAFRSRYGDAVPSGHHYYFQNLRRKSNPAAAVAA